MDKVFKDICGELEEIHRKYPTLKFGQVMQIAVDRKCRKPNTDLTDISSKQTLIALKEYLSFIDETKKRGVSIVKAK